MELESQESLHLRINNVLFNPTQTSTKQAEYSYTFNIPSTPNNDRVLEYASNLSKTNKFHTRYSSQVYADGKMIFDGTLTIQKYDAKSAMYSCNLVNIKINTLEDIFGDDVLTDVKWEVPFDGYETINSVNADGSTKYWFPLICYGAFGKGKELTTDSYTSKYELDYTNKWYINSFYPSLNMMEEVKKCFEYKGYSVGGQAMLDPTLNGIYCSTHLADEQTPTWNLGNPKFGKVSLDISWTCPQDTPSQMFVPQTTYGTVQDLTFPYFKSGDMYWDFSQGDAITKDPDYNFKSIKVYDLFSKEDGANVNPYSASTMFSPDGFINIPADGFYEITVNVIAHLEQTSDITAKQWVHSWNDNVTAMTMDVHEEDITFKPDLRVTTPIEIQLVKNYDEDIELIKGKYNLRLKDGYPDHETEMNKGRSTNYTNWITCFPHEKLGSAGWSTPMPPTKTDRFDGNIYQNNVGIGYAPNDNTLFCYDPIVNPNFICGISTMGNKNGGGTAAVIKNGYSWSALHSDKHDAMYVQNGYLNGTVDSTGAQVWTSSDFNKNEFLYSPTNFYSNVGNKVQSALYTMVHLNKDDKLRLFAIHRYYENMSGDSVTYKTSANISITMRAISPNNLFHLRTYRIGYGATPEFSTDLNLMNFTNKEIKISDWLKNIQDAFNLTYEFNGNSVDININKGIKKDITYAVDIDDRVNSNDAESEYISYPKEMSIRYKINTDEHGFYESVPEEHINDEDWKNWGDSGFTTIKLSDDSYVTTSQNKQTQFSYTWYDNFKVVPPSVITSASTVDISIPVISREEYMIDGFGYEEAMGVRGYNLPQRFWFRNTTPLSLDAGYFLLLEDDWEKSTTPGVDTIKHGVAIYTPKNMENGMNLSYKDSETSLVTEYFNIYPMLASNYVNIETFLNPMEYIQIKGGALVHFDSDLYYTSEISGYDPSGNNPTSLKLIKKV